MDTLLIILVLAAIVVGFVFWVRRKGRKDNRPIETRDEQDTAWNDPTSGDGPRP